MLGVFTLSVASVALSAGAQNSTIVAGYEFTSIDVPGAGPILTVPHHINNSGVITGGYLDANGFTHGFVRAKDGTITSFDAPLAVGFTDAEGINDNGDIVGGYIDASSVVHGFLRDRSGSISSIDVPFLGAQGTVAWAINSNGTIVGFYTDANGNPQVFLRSPKGQFTGVAVPANVLGAESDNINNRGVIEGVFVDSNTVLHGFVRQLDGSIVTFDAPGAGTEAFQGTWTVEGVAGFQHGLNERGDLTGATVDGSYTAHGFLRERDGNFVSFDVPGSGVGNFTGTLPFSINSSGTICGFVADSNGATQGFVRYRDGSIVELRAPGVGSETGAIALNDAGVITGIWSDANGGGHGFVMKPLDDKGR